VITRISYSERKGKVFYGIVKVLTCLLPY